MKKEKLEKYLKGTGKALEELSKEIKKYGIDSKSLELMKKIGSDLLFKGTAIDFTPTKKEIKK